MAAASSTATTITVTTLQGDTMDLLCWRELGTTSGGVVEQAYVLNQNLADQGVILPARTDVILPAVSTAQPGTLETVSLWD